MKNYIGFILIVFGTIFILNSGCSKETGTIVPDIVMDTTYVDSTVLPIDTSLVDPNDTIPNDSTGVYGCTDPEAENYNAEATLDDLTCIYPTIFGCTDPDAENFNPEATNDDGTCEYPALITGDIGDLYDLFDNATTTSTSTINNDFFSFEPGPQGVRLFIEENIFETLAGVPVSGLIDIEMIEVLTKGDMVRYATPTFSNGQLLESGGMFHLSARQNEQELRLRPGRTIQVQVPSENLTGEMSVFYGDESSEILDWAIADSSQIITSEWEDSLNNQGFSVGYELLIDRLGWINCDYFNGDPNLTNVGVSLTDRYSNQNAAVFMVFNDINSVAHLWGNSSSNLFEINNVPIGYEVTFIVIASLSDDENNPEYEFALVTTTITANHLETIVPVPTSLTDIEAALDNL